MDILDQDSIAITNPASAEKYYLPKVIAKEMDLTAVKKELREKHGFSEEDIRITSRVISSAELKHREKNPEGYMKYAPITVALILIIGGAAMAVMFLKNGGIAIGAGITSVAGLFILMKLLRNLQRRD